MINTELGLCTLSVVAPLAIATVWFRRRASRLYDLSRERVAIVNADFKRVCRGCVSPRRSSTKRRRWPDSTV